MNQALLDKLGALAAQAEQQSAREWMQVQVKLTRDTPDGPPAEGYEIFFSNRQGEGSPIEVQRKAPADGLIDLGSLRMGTYALRVTAPWGASSSRRVVVHAGGNSQLVAATCPGRPPAEMELAVEIACPDDLRDSGLALCAEVDYSHLPVAGAHRYIGGASGEKQRRCARVDGMLIEPFKQSDFDQIRIALEGPQNQNVLIERRRNGTIAVLTEAPKTFPSTSIRLLEGYYNVQIERVQFRPIQRSDSKFAVRMIGLRTLGLEQGKQRQFEIAAGQANALRIELDDRTWNLIRQQFRADAADRAASSETPE